jgi:hypothetical protein
MIYSMQRQALSILESHLLPYNYLHDLIPNILSLNLKPAMGVLRHRRFEPELRLRIDGFGIGN